MNKLIVNLLILKGVFLSTDSGKPFFVDIRL